MEKGIWTVAFCLVLMTNTCSGSWGEPGSSQYHIQTDEGPERYFRFQTDNGQFRKEKRLKDGTVIGTDAWIDAAGYLRQKDYIADQKGYRILKSKVVFVGVGRPIEEAIKAVKSVPAQSGVLVDGSEGRNSIVPSTTTRPPNSYSEAATTTETLPASSGYLSPSEAAKIPPSPYLGFDHYPTAPENAVHIRPHSQPVDGNSRTLPKSYYLPPVVSSTPSPDTFQSSFESLRRVRPIGVASSTPAPIAVDDDVIRSSSQEPERDYSYPSSTALPNFSRGFAKFSTITPFSSTYSPYSSSSTSSSPNEIYGDYDDQQSNVYSSSTESSFDESSTPSRSVIPLDVNGLLPPYLPHTYKKSRLRSASSDFPQNTAIPFIQSNSLDNGYEPQQQQEYDGVAATKNGFRYFLPRHYHEEEQIDSQKKAGSYGYIDPFGIRRVVYYNASPNKGFVHRNNNRYVGFSATPYDPRPNT